MIDTNKAWIQTSCGGKFHILDPKQDEVHAVDIAHSLSMMCRWTGHVRRFYSVAEHSWHASYLVPEKDALWALMHDSSEAYISDLSRPLKHFTEVGKIYREVEEKVMAVVCEKFGLPIEQPQTVTEADNAMLYAERNQLMPPVEWDTKWGDEKAACVKIRCWSPDVAKTMFLARYYELTNQI
jgi:hypothetical protein